MKKTLQAFDIASFFLGVYTPLQRGASSWSGVMIMGVVRLRKILLGIAISAGLTGLAVPTATQAATSASKVAKAKKTTIAQTTAKRKTVVVRKSQAKVAKAPVRKTVKAAKKRGFQAVMKKTKMSKSKSISNPKPMKHLSNFVPQGKPMAKKSIHGKLPSEYSPGTC
ncbi:hypothetical protein EON80_23840 [bacterium]|nr:MAG: hypothetical protein EON80_23840 [bacterium]